MSDIADILGKNIRKLRKQLGWTQEKLAEASGISVPFMTQIELGRKSASLEVIEAVAKALSVSYDVLFTSEKESEPFKQTLNVLEKKIISTVTCDIEKIFNEV